jgi:hypothetical protein
LFSDSEPRVSELLADATTEQWPCYSHHDARVVGRIAKILTDAGTSGEFRLEADTEQEARRVKVAACALVEPDVIRLCRDKHDVRTREALSRLIATALLNQSASPGGASPHPDSCQTLPIGRDAMTLKNIEVFVDAIPEGEKRKAADHCDDYCRAHAVCGRSRAL